MFKKFKSISPAAKSSLAYTICNILQKSISFITLPIFTRLLTTEQVGQYTIYTTWSAVFTILITLNMSFGTFDRAMVRFERDRYKYTSSIRTIVFIILGLMLAIYLPLSQYINNFLSLPTPLVLLMFSEIVAVFAFHSWCSEEKFNFRWHWVVIITIVMSAAAPVLAYFLVINNSEKGYARIIGYASINIAVGLFFIFFNYFKGKKVFSKEFWKYALTFNIPLIPYYFSQIIFNQSDKIMIEKLVGLSEAGIYGIAYSFALILSFVLTAMNSGYVPWLYRKIKNKDYKANRAVTILLTVIFSTLIVGVIWITPEFIHFLAPDEYNGAIYVVPPIALSLILLQYSQFSINIEFYNEQKWYLVGASLLAAGLNIGLNFWLIPIYGYLAAGYTTLASYVVFAVSNYFCIFKKVRKGGELQGIFNELALVLLFFFFAGMGFLGMFLFPYPIAT